MKKVIFFMGVISMTFLLSCSPKSTPLAPTVSGGEVKGNTTSVKSESIPLVTNIYFGVYGKVEIQRTDYSDYRVKVRVVDVVDNSNIGNEGGIDGIVAIKVWDPDTKEVNFSTTYVYNGITYTYPYSYWWHTSEHKYAKVTVELDGKTGGPPPTWTKIDERFLGLIELKQYESPDYLPTKINVDGIIFK